MSKFAQFLPSTQSTKYMALKPKNDMFSNTTRDLLNLGPSELPPSRSTYPVRLWLGNDTKKNINEIYHYL